MSDPSPSGETWVCRANPAVYGVCTSPIGAIPGHNGCGPVPSSDTPSDERRPVDVTALPEWAAFVKRHQHYGGLGLGQHGECADCSLIEAVAAADRGDRA